MSEGIYNKTYFDNDHSRRLLPGLLYVVVLVNKKTNIRECVKIGIAKGTNYRHAIKRANGFDGYEIRIQKLCYGTIYEMWKLEQHMHNIFDNNRYTASKRFGGHTELFALEVLPDILQEISKAKNIT